MSFVMTCPAMRLYSICFIRHTIFIHLRMWDIEHMTKNEVIADILREYERFISLVSDKKNELLVIEK